jgi:carboxyl-terminal processing protease
MSENQYYIFPENPQAPLPEKPRRHSFWKYALTALIAAVLTFAITAGAGLAYYAYLKSSGYVSDGQHLNLSFENNPDTRTALEKLRTVLSEIDNNYYKDLTDAEMLEAMTKGLVDELGNPYTMYLSAEQNKILKESMSGNYSGIGAFVGLTKDGLVEITEVIQGSPAEEAGIMVGDLFIEVNGQDVTTVKDTNAVAVLVRGIEGTTVDIVMYRPSVQKNINMTVTRRKITTASISSKMLTSTVGYIMIREFSSAVSVNFINAVEDLKARGAKNIVFDLRNDGGGLASEVIAMLDYLLPDAVIATLKGRSNGEAFSESWTSGATMGVPESMRYAIIINNYTASASELFAGCLRDNDKARLFGEQSFGKGSGTITYELTDGSAVNITNFLYYLPDGESIEGTGLTPDVAVSLPDAVAGKSIVQLTIDEDTQLKAALEYLKTLG